MNAWVFSIILWMNLLQTTIVFGTKPVITLYAISSGVSTLQISVIVAAYALVPAFTAVQIGKWTDKYDLKRISIIGNGLILLSVWLGTVYASFWILVLQQTILGVANTFCMLSQQKRVGNLGMDVDRAIANYSLVSSLGAMLGPIIGTTLYEHFGYQAFCYANAALISVAMLSGFFLREEERKKTDGGEQPEATTALQDRERESIWGLLRNRDLRNAILISGLVLSNRELFSAYFPLLAEKLGISPTMIGFLLAFNGLMMLIVRFCQNALVRTFGRMHVLTYSLYISGIIYLVTPSSSWLVLLFVLVGVLGGGLGLGQPLSISSVLENSPPQRAGEVLGIRVTINRLSQFAIPLVFGGVGGMAGVSAVFWASGLVLACFGYLTRPVKIDVQPNREKLAD